jgi:hypothetical protein
MYKTDAETFIMGRLVELSNCEPRYGPIARVCPLFARCESQRRAQFAIARGAVTPGSTDLSQSAGILQSAQFLGYFASLAMTNRSRSFAQHSANDALRRSTNLAAVIEEHTADDRWNVQQSTALGLFGAISAYGVLNCFRLALSCGEGGCYRRRHQ